MQLLQTKQDKIATVSQSGTSIVVTGDITAQNFFVEQYEFEFQFSNNLSK